MVYVGKGSYVFFKRESSWNNSEVMGQSGVNHIPFNPMVAFSPPKPRYQEAVIYTFDSLEPSIIYTTILAPGEADIETLFRDPWLLLNGVFTRITKTHAWTGTTDQITGDFTTQSHVNTMAIQYYINDDAQSDYNIERTLKGCEVLSYIWVIQPGGLLREIVRMRSASFADASQAPDIANGFDGGEFDQSGVNDGGFANWSQSGTNSGFFHASDITLTWGGVALSGIDIKDFRLTINVPKTYQHTFDSKVASIHWKGTRSWNCEINGWLKTKTHVEEIEKIFADKTTTNTLQISLGTNYYLQFTNSYIANASVVGIPASGQPVEFKLIINGGISSVLSFLGEWTIGTDPAPMISYTAA